MSQISSTSSGSPPPPSDGILTLTGQFGTNPVGPDIAGNVNVFAEDSSVNNLAGVQTRGDMAGNTVYVTLTNRINGFISTNDATPTTLITFALGLTPGVYHFDGSIEAFNTTDTAGGAYTFSSAIRTTGAAGVEIGTELKDLFEEAAMSTSDFTVSVSGNNLLVTVTGVAGKAIDWRGLMTYRFVG